MGGTTMYALLDDAGQWAKKRDGSRFTYESRELARRAARILTKHHGVAYRVVDA